VGSLTTVTYYVREQKRRTKEVFVPLSHRPGHAQVDFGDVCARYIWRQWQLV